MNVETPSTLEGLASARAAEGRPARSGARWRGLRLRIDDAKGEARDASRTSIVSMPKSTPQRAKAPRFAPAGQSTQMVVGADGESDDAAVMRSSAGLYGARTG